MENNLNILNIERFVSAEDENKTLSVRISEDCFKKIIKNAVTLTAMLNGRNYTEEEGELGATLMTTIHYLLFDSTEDELNYLANMSKEIDEAESEEKHKT